MEIKIRKITGADLLHEANKCTTGKESTQTLGAAYLSRHTTIRTQIFFVQCLGIPQFVAYHLRTHFTLFPMPPFEMGWMRSKRMDRGGHDFRHICQSLGADLVEAMHANDWGLVPEVVDEIHVLPDKYDRNAPTDFCFMISAEGLITLADKRMCIGSVSPETRGVVEIIKEKVCECDPALYPHLVRPCVARSRCLEKKCCGFIKTKQFRRELTDYNALFPKENLPDR